MSINNQKVFKFGFAAYIQSLKLALKFPCTISIIWKRGEKLAEVRQRKQILNGVATFNQYLNIECNMIFDVDKKAFEVKKTIFSILIFTDKGTKQAGQVQLDVSQILNKHIEQSKYEINLLKCPDKNASLSFTLKPYLKQQIKMDTISQSSFKTVDLQKVAGTINSSVANFKKKQKIEQVIVATSQNIMLPSKSLKSQKEIKQNAIHDEKIRNLEDLNKKLRDDIKESKKENQKLKKMVERNNQNLQEWKKKYESMKNQYQQLKNQTKNIKVLQAQNKQLQSEVLQCRHKLANIFNAAIQIGGPQLTVQLQEASGYIENKK